MKTWTVECGSCGHAWSLAGNWSVYEREVIESRPCPGCGAYTLNSPEPKAVSRDRRTRPVAAAAEPRAARWAG